MKNTLKLLSVVLLLTVGAWCQQSTTGNLTASGSDCTTGGACVQLTNLQSPSLQVGGAVLTLSGTWSGTVQFEASGDGGKTWVSVNAYPLNSTTAATSTTSAGSWQVNVSGFTGIRLRCSAFSSGPIVATIQTSTAAASAGHGSGASSTSVTAPSGLTTGDLPVATGPFTLGDSLFSDNGSTGTYGGSSFAVSNGSGIASLFGMQQGTVQPSTVAQIGLTAPTSVTGYNRVFAGVSTTGFPFLTDSSASGSEYSTESIIAPSGTKCYPFSGSGGSGCDNPTGSGTITGGGATGQVAYYSGATAITGSTALTFAPATLSLGQSGVGSGVLNFLGTTSGTASLTSNATATTLTLGGAGTSFLVPAGTVSQVAIGTAVNTGLFVTANSFGYTIAGSANLSWSGSQFKLFGGNPVYFFNGAGTSSTVYGGGVDAGSFAQTWGSATLRGGEPLAGSATGGISGAVIVRGGDNITTGATETAGNATIRAGRASAAGTTNVNGQLLIEQVYVKGAAATAGLVACVGAADLTMTDCSGTSVIPILGITQVITGAAVDVAVDGSIINNGTSNASTAFTRGHYACLDTANGIQYVKDSASACAIGTKVGIIIKTETSANAHVIQISLN